MIRFLLDDEEIALDPAHADLTVLDWLRLHRRRTGTKEGCGSGDCGACTVIVVSLAENGRTLVRETVNACIAFVGSLHGCRLLTVESLADGASPHAPLHPAQRALVDEHGSQCGFCTPGFVMSIAALCSAPDAPRVRWTDDRPARHADRPDTATPRGAATPVAESRSPAMAAAIGTESTTDTSAVSGGAGVDDVAHADPIVTRVDANAVRPISATRGWLDGLTSDDDAALGHRIDRVLGGNLCRCTGYRPIRRAAAVALAASHGASPSTPSVDGDAADAAVVARLQAIAEPETRDAPGWHAPQSIGALAALRLAHPDVPLIAGGTDLALEVTQSLRRFDSLIHVGAVPELRLMHIDGNGLEIGAGVTLTRLLTVIEERLPAARELLLRFGSDQIRNRGTVGGNIGSASPIGDLAPLLIALDATLVLQRGDASRSLPLESHFLGYRKTTLQPGEFIRAVRFAWPAPADRLVAWKVSKRYDDDISTVAGAFRLRLDGDRVGEVRLAFGGMAATPKRAVAAEAALLGKRFDADALQAARDALAQDFTPLDDARASANYRAAVAANLLTRLHLSLTGDTRVRVHAMPEPGLSA